MVKQSDAPPEQAAPQRRDRSRRRVLVAEDNVVNQMVIRALLESAGIEVEVVDNGLECVERITSIQPDIVLMDCQMPVCDGYTATSRLRAAGWTLPIIAVTASVAAEVEERCRAAGMSGFLPKPVSRAGLLQLIADHAPLASTEAAGSR